MVLTRLILSSTTTRRVFRAKCEFGNKIANKSDQFPMSTVWFDMYWHYLYKDKTYV